MKLISKIKTIPYLRHFTNIYVITSVVFGVWMIFFSSNNLLSQHKLRKQLKDHKVEREYYLREIEINKRNINLLDNDLEHLEKIAREKFLMKRDNEDIFIFVEE
ncbi:MAG: septum formation initiator family protein [Bacteroidales bacterium]|jgi:cell division protein FtsB|nr:septum formation initiator family protein [Bacteroidales bacterium]